MFSDEERRRGVGDSPLSFLVLSGVGIGVSVLGLGAGLGSFPSVFGTFRNTSESARCAAGITQRLPRTPAPLLSLRLADRGGRFSEEENQTHQTS